MDHRILLGISGATGAVLGVALMVWTAPDTGLPSRPPPELVATTPLGPPGRDGLADVERPLPPAARPAPGARAGVTDTDAAADNPFAALGDDAPAGDDPLAGWGALAQDAGDNPFGDPGGNPFAEDNPFGGGGGAAGNPFAEDGANPWAGMAGQPIEVPEGAAGQPTTGRTFTPQVFGASSDLPPDVRGVGRLFREKDFAINDCMTRLGPAAVGDERRVMVRVHIAARGDAPSKGGIVRIEAPKDPEGRYQQFLSCATSVVADAEFQLPPGGTASVNWSVRRL